MSELYYLYKIENIVNSKIYIGITKNPKSRKYQHFNGSPSYVSKISAAVKKYGKENFSFKVICIGEKSYIVELEEKAIEAFDSINNGYNIRTGGQDCGSGHTIKHRSDDQPVFVSGFWFPNRRTCLNKLCMNEKTFHKRKLSRTLGDIQHLRTDSVKDRPCYVGGFWFPNMTYASSSLNKKLSAIKALIHKGNVEVIAYKSEAKQGTKNPMFGKTGSAHHNSRSIIINGVTYDSIASAVRQTEFTKSMIEKRLKNKTPGFSYAVEVE